MKAGARLVSLTLAATSIATACTSTPSATPSPSPAPVDSNLAVVRIDQTTGMMPPWISLEWYPSVAVYADGRVIVPGPMVELYPGPALPNLTVTRVTQAGLGQILELAASAGLRGPDRTLGEPLLDSGTTNFTVVTGGGRHMTQVWSLADPGDEIAAVRQFQDALLSLRTWLGAEVVGEDEPYAWDRLRILSTPTDPNSSPDPALASIVDWPLGPLGSAGISLEELANYRCGLVEGARLDTLRPILAVANELTLWRSDGETYAVKFHPLLPDDEACPGA
jgi:hypothetical protein